MLFQSLILNIFQNCKLYIYPKTQCMLQVPQANVLMYN